MSPTDEPLDDVRWKRPGGSYWAMLLRDAMDRSPLIESSVCRSSPALRSGVGPEVGGDAERARAEVPGCSMLGSEPPPPPCLVLPMNTGSPAVEDGGELLLELELAL